MELWNSAVQFLNNLLSWSSAKAVCAAVLAGVCSASSAALNLAHPSIFFLIALVCIDFALAAGIAWQEDRFTWPGFMHGLGKFLAYALIFIVTTIADYGMGIAGWPLNLTVAVSCYAIAGESISSLRHIDHIFPGHLPNWVIKRLETIRSSIERDASGPRTQTPGHGRGHEDWRGYWRESEAERNCPLKSGTAPEEETEVPGSRRSRQTESIRIQEDGNEY